MKGASWPSPTGGADRAIETFDEGGVRPSRALLIAGSAVRVIVNSSARKAAPQAGSPTPDRIDETLIASTSGVW
jgi:hypothetical protein